MTTPETYTVETVAYGIWRVVARHLGGKCVFMTEDHLAALRTRDELDRAYREGFYHGLLTGHGEVHSREDVAA